MGYSRTILVKCECLDERLLVLGGILSKISIYSMSALSLMRVQINITYLFPTTLAWSVREEGTEIIFEIELNVLVFNA